MKLDNLTIGKQLALGLGCLLVLVVLLGIVTSIQEESLWKETKGLYDHPLQVRRALANIQVDILSMHRGLKDLVLSRNESEWQGIVQESDTFEADADQNFAILYERYLGPHTDIDTAYADFVQWRSIREKTIRLMEEGRYEEAQERVRPSGVGGDQVTRIMDDIAVISDFAQNRGDLFYQEAESLKNTLIMQLSLLIMVILLLSILVIYLLLRGIRAPVLELTRATEAYRLGNRSARCRYDSDNELGMLSRSFNTLVGKIETELKSREDTGLISEIMLREEDLIKFCEEVLKNLLIRTGSQVGAMYLLNDEKSEFFLVHSIGLPLVHLQSFSATSPEGEFGLSAATGKIQRITQIPADIAGISTTGCEIRPREIITIPVLNGAELIALISLSSVADYSAGAIRLIEDITGMLTARFCGVVSNARNRELSDSLEDQNRELSAQARELLSQTRELKEQNVELAVQKQQLDKANRLKSVFLSNMSHELRTPLNSVIALSGVLIRRLSGTIPDDEYSYLEIIERNGRLLLTLINDILDIARIESGHEEFHITTFLIPHLVDSVCDTVAMQAEEKGIALQHQIDGDIPPISSDFQKCRHILQNLVANAVKFTGKGSVSISAAVSESMVFISVTDTGIGIHAEMIPYIFDEFRQGDERIGRMYGGSGLGLAIARKYARLLQGDISVSSVPGSGSTFTLSLPLKFEGGEMSQAEPDAPGDPAGDRTDSTFEDTGTILLVEDNEAAVIQIRDLLEEKGYRIRVARNGKDALEQLGGHLPDAVILDLMMPDVDGFTVLRMIRSQERSARLPVLILTAKHITAEELQCLKGNAIHQLIQKGDINRRGLLSAVRNMLGREKKKDPVRSSLPADTAARNPLILVIEDNPDNLITARALLEDKAELIGAADGRSGIDQARLHRPDIILLDISLPEKDGFQVLEELKQDEQLKKIPVVALTARAMSGDRDEILSRGFDAYLSKPLDEELLRKTVYRLLHE